MCALTAKHARIEDSGIPALSVQSVAAGYGKGAVISDISFSVGQGETFGLIGLNGAGKTTLIKSVLGLREPFSGTIAIRGKDRLDQESKMETAYLPERFDPPWFLTGLEFIKFSANLYGRPCDVSRIEDAAQALALDPKVLRHRVQTFSKGMRQKLGLLATFLTGCHFLILDEPMSGLDPRARARVKDFLERIRNEGRTVFLSSHILSDMTEICQKIGVIHGGTLIFLGTPSAMLKQTRTDTLERAFLVAIEAWDQGQGRDAVSKT